MYYLNYMNKIFKISILALNLFIVACNDETSNNLVIPPSNHTESKYYQTKTPYQPQQDLKSYEPVPSGFQPVFTEMVARHGSRGLSSLKYDLALYHLWKQAKSRKCFNSFRGTTG